MKMKVFHADTMHDAIRAIKEELGPDALILSTKRVRRGSLPFSLFGRSLLEVTAATDSIPGPSRSRPAGDFSGRTEQCLLCRESTRALSCISGHVECITALQ